MVEKLGEMRKREKIEKGGRERISYREKRKRQNDNLKIRRA